MAKISLNEVAGGYNLSHINGNFQRIEDVLNSGVLWRDLAGNTDSNQMEEPIDMNGNRIYNLPYALSPHEPVTLAQLAGFAAGDGGPIEVLPATNVTYEPKSPLVSNNVQGALDELAQLIQVSYPIASEVDITPIAGLSAANVQQALEELKTSVAALEGGSGAIPLLNTLADLRAFVRGSKTLVRVQNHSSVGDGGGGLYVYVPTLTSDLNGGIVLASGGGSWLLVDSPTVRHFGAKGQAANETAHIQNALNFAATFRRNLHVPAGRYLVSSIVYYHTYLASINITGDGHGITVIEHLAGNSGDMFRLENTSSPTDIGPNGLTVKDIHFKGNHPETKPTNTLNLTHATVSMRIGFVNTFVGCRFSHGTFGFSNQHGVLDRFELCQFDKNFYGLRVYGDIGTTTWVHQSDLKNNYLFGLHVEDARHVVCSMCSIEANGSVEAGGGVHVGNTIGNQPVSGIMSRGVTLRDCWIENNIGASAIALAGGLNSIQGCIFSNQQTAYTIRVGGGRYHIKDTLFELGAVAHIYEEKTALVYSGNVVLDCVVGSTKTAPICDVDPVKTRTSYDGSSGGGGGGGGSGDVVGPSTAVDNNLAAFNTTTGKLLKDSGVSVSSLQTSINSKQAQLVSGVNIRTVNGTSLLGSGDIEISGGGGTVTSKPKIVIIGDSFSAKSDMLEPAWPEQLEQQLRVYGADVEVHNLSVIGHSFALASNPIYGTMSLIDKAISLNPTVVVVALGLNDTVTGGSAFPGTLKGQIDSTLSQLRTGLPDATILYASIEPWDRTHNSAGTGIINRQISPWGMQRPTTGYGAGKWSSEILNSAIRSDIQANIQQWIAMDNYLKPHGNLNGFIQVSHFKMARLGLTGLDSIHPSAEGSKFVAAQVRKGLQGNAGFISKFPNMRTWTYNLYEDPDTLFSEFCESSGGNYVNRTRRIEGETGWLAREHVSAHNINMQAIRVDTWYMPTKGSVNSQPSSIPALALWTVTVSNCTPKTTAKMSVDGAAAVDIPLITDAAGNGSYVSGAWTNFSGARQYRLIIGDEMYGPFAVTIDNTSPGNVVGPASAVNNRIAIFSGTTGKIVADGGRTLSDIDTSLNAKQATLVSGSNIRTVNGNSLLGSGNISISGQAPAVYNWTTIGAQTIAAGSVDVLIGSITVSQAGIVIVNWSIGGTFSNANGRMYTRAIIGGSPSGVGSQATSSSASDYSISAGGVSTSVGAGTIIHIYASTTASSAFNVTSVNNASAISYVVLPN